MNIITTAGFKKRKKIIYKEAQNLFSTKGYKATTMRDLAEVVGIKAASLYSHINSKAEILEFICFNLSDTFFKIQQVNKEISENLTTNEKLINAVKSHIFVISENLEACSVYFTEWKNLNSNKLEDFEKRLKKYEKIFIDLIKEGTNNLEIKQIDEKFVAKTLLTTLNGLSYSQHSKNINFEQIGEKIALLYLNGIKQ